MSLSKIDGVLEVPISETETLHLSKRVANRVKCRYEDWLEGRARRRVFQLKAEMSAKEYQDSMDAVARQAAAGTFEWAGDAWETSLKQMPGIIAMIRFLADEADLHLQSPQKLNEETIFGWMANETTRDVLVGAMKEVMSASPNFPCPPIRAREG